MPRPIPVPIRQTMFRLWKQGCGDPSDRRVLGPAVLHRSPSPPEVSAPRSRRHLARLPLPLGHLHEPLSEMVHTAVPLRREHPTWGAGLIRVQLLLMAPGWPVPSGNEPSNVGLCEPICPQPPAGRPPAAGSTWTWVTAPHETWQMDTKEHIQLQNYSRSELLAGHYVGSLHRGKDVVAN